MIIDLLLTRLLNQKSHSKNMSVLGEWRERSLGTWEGRWGASCTRLSSKVHHEPLQLAKKKGLLEDLIAMFSCNAKPSIRSPEGVGSIIHSWQKKRFYKRILIAMFSIRTMQFEPAKTWLLLGSPEGVGSIHSSQV